MSSLRPYVTDPFHPLGSISNNESFLYTAISIYVVGSKVQAYATRPKGGMGRLELILGFRVVGAKWTWRLKIQSVLPCDF